MNTDNEKCARCGALGKDRRTLWMACFYEMMELGVPFEQVGLRGALAEKPKGTEQTFLGKRVVLTDTWRDRDKIEEIDQLLRVFYTLRVCKGCRSEWMRAIETWFRATPTNEAAYNSNEASSPDEIASLLAQVEELRTQAIAVQQRLCDTLRELRAEKDRRLALASP